MANVSVFCFLASYLVAFVLELSRLLGRSQLSRVVMLGFGVAGLVAHTFYLFYRSQATQLPPLLSSAQDWVLVLAWLLVLFYLFLTALDRELAVGAFALPIVLILIGSAYLMNDQPNQILNAQRGWKMLHASGLVLGMGAVVVGFVSGVMYLVQHHRLKTRHAAQTGWQMPSLERLALVNRWSIMISFPMLTVGFGTGVILGIYSRTSEQPVSFADPTVIISGVLWSVLAGLFVWLLTQRRPRGKQVAWLTIGGLGFLLLTLVGLQIVTGTQLRKLETWHASTATDDRGVHVRTPSTDA